MAKFVGREGGGVLVGFVRACVGCLEYRELFYKLGCGLCVDSFVSRLSLVLLLMLL